MFDPGLKGHLTLRDMLRERLGQERLPGTLLFTGPEAVGKRRVALELAQRELCFRRSACGACEACKLFVEPELLVELPNLLRIAPEGKAGLIKVGAVRDSELVEGGVIRWAHLSPPPGCHRWILIEDVHRLHGYAANMLLKSLEEPPPGTHFILVTHRPEALLQTIRSRAHVIPFAPLAPEEAWAVALSAGWDPSQKEPWLALADGTLRFLEEAAYLRGKAQVEAWLALGEGAAFDGVADPLLPEKESTVGQSEQVRPALDLLMRILADLGRIRAGRPASLGPWQGELVRWAGRDMDLLTPLEAVSQALRSLVRNPSPEPLLREMALYLRGGT